MNPDTYIAPVFNRLLDKAERHVKYIVSTSNYVRTLQKKREVLNARKNDINRIIKKGERRSKRPTDEVIVWQSQVAAVLDGVDTAINKAEETGSCVCSICTKYKVGHSCDDMNKEIDELLVRASLFQNAEMVDCDTSNTAVPMPYVVAKSQDQYFTESCKFIEDDSSNVDVIGIWGLGGVGKTTLLSKIHNHFVGTSSMFDTVVWTVASSKQSDIFKIQSEIVKKLRLKIDKDVQSQANIINRYLENTNFLLFIDDLWKDVDLHKVGVPNLNVAYHYGKKRKVIFTTRSTVVCGNMEARKIIEVKCLDPKQSLVLFIQKAGEEVIQSHPAIPKLAEDIAKECKGLPLALITIGRAMSTKLNIEDWKRILNLLKDSEGYSDLDVEEKLLFVLKISYDNLATEQLKKCFLTISMWPEDQIINSRVIIEFWMGHDLIVNFESKRDAYQLGHSLIQRLQGACLLEHVATSTGDEDGVRMHDVLRDLALWLVSDCGKNKNKWMVKAGLQMQKATNVKPKWREAECISLMHNRIEELPYGIHTCPSLLTLVLKNNSLTSGSRFGNFHSLIHLDLSNNYMNTFPESICNLAELRYLNLSSNVMTNLPIELGNLKSLRYLILRNNLIGKIARGVFSELRELLVLDMLNAINTWVLPSVDVEELKSIKENLLCFGTTVGSEKELSKLMLLSELPLDELAIEHMVSATFHLFAMISDPHRLLTLQVANCSSRSMMEIVIDKNDTARDFASFNLEILRLIELEGLKRITWKGIAPEILFAELQEIAIDNCPFLEDITWTIYLPSLKILSICECHSMKIAVNNDVDAQVLTFPSLQVFYLDGIDSLEKISIRTMAFPQLKQLSIKGCNLLSSLPFEVKTTPKLIRIEGYKHWWEDLKWEDDNSRYHFNQFFNHR